jgi:hypothetical protein
MSSTSVLLTEIFDLSTAPDSTIGKTDNSFQPHVMAFVLMGY